MEEGSKALKLVREQLYINLATVPQEIDLMRRETKGIRKSSSKGWERTIV